MNEQLLQELLKRLDAVAGTAVSGGKWAFTQLVHSRLAEAWTYLILWGSTGILILVLTQILAKRAKRLATDENTPSKSDHVRDKSDYKDDVILFNVLSIVGALVFLFSVSINLPTILAPEASVIKQLLGQR